MKIPRKAEKYFYQTSAEVAQKRFSMKIKMKNKYTSFKRGPSKFSGRDFGMKMGNRRGKEDIIIIYLLANDFCH